MDRGEFRIHPTAMNSYNNEPNSNDGCISPYPSENSVAFYKEIIKVLTNSGFVIPLYVDIDDNFNISVQLKNYGTKKIIKTLLIINCIAGAALSYGQNDSANCESGFDTEINGIRYDNNNPYKKLLKLSDKKISKINNKIYEEGIETAFDAKYFLSNNKYIMIANLETDGDSGFDYFEMGYVTQGIKKRHIETLEGQREFITNNGIYLGISTAEFWEKIQFHWGKFKLVTNGIKIGDKIYEIYYHTCNDCSGTGSRGWLAGMDYGPEYIARYVFCNGKLVKFGFGSLPYHPTHEFEDIL